MANKNSKTLYDSKTLKKAVSEAVKGSSYHLKGSSVAKPNSQTNDRKVITVKK